VQKFFTKGMQSNGSQAFYIKPDHNSEINSAFVDNAQCIKFSISLTGGLHKVLYRVRIKIELSILHSCRIWLHSPPPWE
jgi:hypothetical protein